MIDTSDGLLGDLGHICRASGVGAQLIQESLPLGEALQETAMKQGLDPYDIVLHDSDDYELIITCSSNHVDRIRSLIQALSDVAVTEVGQITEDAGSIKLIRRDGTAHEIFPGGWDHFGLRRQGNV